mgnify:CR=1 FL=1
MAGLYQKAVSVKEIPANWLGTLEAIILKMPTRYKSTEAIVPSPINKKDEETGKLITAILLKYPQHKRVLFLQSKYENNEILGKEEIAELKRFSKISPTPRPPEGGVNTPT